MARHTVVSERITHSAPSVTNSTTTVLAANVGRVRALLVNDGTEAVWLALDGETAVANIGIYLGAKGNYDMSGVYDNIDADKGDVSAISASGTVIVLVTEWDNF